MKVKCFGCDALIEADDSGLVADAFVAHGQESHTWSYPEEAIRNYARNYAEATERLTGGTERLSRSPTSQYIRSPRTASTIGSGSSTMTPSPATPIAPRAIA